MRVLKKIIEKRKRKKGTGTFIRELAHGVKLLEVQSDKQGTEFELQINQVVMELEKRFEALIKEYEGARKKKDKEHSRQITELKDRILELEKTQAVSQAKAGGVGALAGGGLGGLVVLIKTLRAG